MKTFLILIVLFLTPFISGIGGVVIEIPSQISTVRVYSGMNVTNASELQDVNAPAPGDNQVLSWDATSLMWMPKDASAVGDTNETTRFNTLIGTNCTGNNKMVGVNVSGIIICQTDNNTVIIDTNCTGGGCDTLYTANESGLNTNSSIYWNNLSVYNVTQMDQSGDVLTILESWFSIVFDALFGAKTTDDLTQGSTNLYDNVTWNQSHSDTLYTDTNWSTSALQIFNQTGVILSSNFSWTSTYNATYDAKENCNASGSCASGNVAYMNYNNSGYLNISQNITILQNHTICLNAVCDRYIFDNGTDIVIQG